MFKARKQNLRVLDSSPNFHSTRLNTRRQTAKKKEKALTPAKRRAFLIITLSLPLLLFITLEIGLRVFHYGQNLSLFTEDVIGGENVYIQNQDVKARYFSRFLFSPSTSPDYFCVIKPAGTFRIFCLGGSTTVGYPYWYNGAFSTFLRDRLKVVFPEKEIEIVNVGMTATNSHTVLDMAEDLVDYEPDLFIVYDGHNEFYGALGVASHESFARSRWLTRAYLKLVHYRTFLLLRDLYQEIASLFRGASAPDMGGTMMEKLARGQYITYGSTLYREGLDVFKSNLDDLKTLCKQHNIPLILSSQVSNLRNQPPFISDEPAEMPGKKFSFNIVFNAAVAHWLNGRVDSALAGFRSAILLDSLHAEAHYRIAQCFDSLGFKQEARIEYTKARDFDRLRFRMSTDFNNLVRDECDQPHVVFADIERMFEEHSPNGIVGNELIVEHLHPNSRGYFLIAKEYTSILREHRFIASAEEWNSRDTVDDESLWQNRNITEIDEVIAKRRTDILTSGWPFQAQTPTVDPVATHDTLGHIAEEVTRARWTWERAHTEAADYYLGRGETDKAAKEYQTLIRMIPVEVDIHLKLAKLYLEQKNYEATRLQLLASLEVEKTILAYRALGDIYMNMNRPKEAVGFYEKTFTFEQSPAERVDNGYLLALAYARANMPDRSATQLLQVLNIKPDYQPAVKLLSEIKSAQQQH
ncbi:MAG: hypothetical protein HW412_1862 [Bacteroidetes bacterium]|nr:hypothetical protein [Bacteroidota bacterium]